MTDGLAAEHATGDTLVASSVVGSVAAAKQLEAAAAPAVDGASAVEPAPAPPAAEPSVAEPALRAQPIMRAERLASPTLVAKVVPVAKAIPIAEPVAPELPAAETHLAEEQAVRQPKAVAEPIAATQPITATQPIAISPLTAVVQTTERPVLDPYDPQAVPLTMLGYWLWHARNLLIATNLSMFVHIAAIVALGTIFVNPPDKPKPPPALEVAVLAPVPKKFEPPPPKIEVTKLPLPKAPSSSTSKGGGSGSAGSGGGIGGGDVGGLHLNPIKIDAVAKLSTGGTKFGTDNTYGPDMLGEVGETLDPKDAKANFFGVEAKGKNFIFVVDTSGSMSKNDRYLRCRTELLRSIGALKPQQKFFVAFFNHTTFAMPENKLVPAVAAQITRTQEWCKLAVPSGGTDPSDGLMRALKLKPDAIYLLTDGDFDPAIIDRLKYAQAERKPIPIHTICFESLSGAPVMEAIAKMTGATYLYVP